MGKLIRRFVPHLRLFMGYPYGIEMNHASSQRISIDAHLSTRGHYALHPLGAAGFFLLGDFS